MTFFFKVARNCADFDKLYLMSFVGIDLGTSNSSIASFINGRHEILADEANQRLTPSVVSFGKDKKILVGHDAKAQIFVNPSRTISSIKRLIGRKIFSPEVKKAQSLLPYQLVEIEDQNVGIKIDDSIFTPQEISALILRHLKEIAVRKLGDPIVEAVVTVPAHFNDNQRQATKDACKIAGLETLRMINEPTAAALAYGFGKGLKETVAIYDLGGGTFDISILRLRDQVFEVMATAGDTFLGGDDFDDRIIDLCSEAFLKEHHVDLRKLTAAIPILRTNAEKAKRILSYADKTDIYIPAIIQKEGSPIDLQYTLTRDAFTQATQELMQRTFTVCDEALRNAEVKASDLDAVILVGGPTKMAIIYEAVGSYFGKAPLRDLNPDEVVSIGASIQAQSLGAKTGKEKTALLLDVTPLDLGIATVGGYIETVVEANTPIPTHAERNFTTTSNDQESVQIQIYQGKHRRVEDSHLLGNFELSGIRKAKAGDVTIQVNFAINTDGIVEVSAKDKDTGATQSIRVKLSAALTEEKLKASTSVFQNHKEVRLKNEHKDFHPYVACLMVSTGNPYIEGYLKKFNSEVDRIELVRELPLKNAQILERNKLAWILELDDFANTPRYLQALKEKPTQLVSTDGMALCQFKLKDKSIFYGLADPSKLGENGFWVKPIFVRDQLPGRIFLYSHFVTESKAL